MTTFGLIFKDINLQMRVVKKLVFSVPDRYSYYTLMWSDSVHENMITL